MYFLNKSITDYAILAISYVHAVLTIRIRLICQKWDLIETESETYKSQMYGHNAGQPLSSLYTMY
jgi:hypothetical protein